MYTDLFGKRRAKLALHQHTTRSDAIASPEEVARLYREHGYDAVALTDHWVWGEADEIEGMQILPGCEYHTGSSHAVQNGICHIVALCCERDPGMTRAVLETVTPQELIDAIHEAGGLAILAHPAWSMNTPEMISRLRGVDAVEIYNTTSRCGNNRRPDSSILVDELAAHYGILLPISGADDSHRYTNPRGNYRDYCGTWVMAECEDTDPASIKRAIREKRFYTTQGPEIHLSRRGNRFIVDCSPVSEIVFFSNFVVDADSVLEGEGLTHFEYETKKEGMTHVRAMVIDADGRMAWSQFIKV